MSQPSAETIKLIDALVRHAKGIIAAWEEWRKTH